MIREREIHLTPAPSAATPRRWGRRRDSQRGVSLVEMLVTLAIMLILFVMLYGFSSASHQRQQKLVCQKNLSVIHLALEIFAREHDGAFPADTNALTSEDALAPLVPKYTATTELFICPGSKDKAIPDGESFARRRISYAYYMGQRAGSSTELLMSDQQIDTRKENQQRGQSAERALDRGATDPSKQAARAGHAAPKLRWTPGPSTARQKPQLATLSCLPKAWFYIKYGNLYNSI